MKISLLQMCLVVLLSKTALGSEAMTRSQSANVNSNTDNDPLDEYFETESTPGIDRGLTAQTSTSPDSQSAGVPAAKDTTARSSPSRTTKKKKKRTDSAPIESISAAGHGAQESNLPYTAAVEIDVFYMSENRTQKYSNESYKIATTNLEFGLEYLFVLSRFEVGPVISYSTKTEKNETISNSTTTTKGMALGAELAFNFGNIHQDKVVPFVGLTIDRNAVSVTNKTEGSSETKVSDTEIRPAFNTGAKIFMGGHVALKPQIQYQLIMGGEHKIESSGDETLVARVTGSNLMVGLGLAKYF